MSEISIQYNIYTNIRNKTLEKTNLSSSNSTKLIVKSYRDGRLMPFTPLQLDHVVFYGIVNR